MNDLAAATVELAYVMRQEICPTCGGAKWVLVPGETTGRWGPTPDEWEPCPDCEGEGAERDDEPVSEEIPFCEDERA